MKSFALSLLLGSAAAQTSVMRLFYPIDANTEEFHNDDPFVPEEEETIFPEFNPDAFDGVSIAGADATYTTYVLDGSSTMTQGPSTFYMDVSSVTVDCFQTDSNALAACNFMFTISPDGSTTFSNFRTIFTDWEASVRPMTITAGLGKLDGTNTGSPSSPTMTAPGPSSSVQAPSVPTNTETPATSTEGAAPTPSDEDGAAPMVTMNAVAAGMAVVAGGVMML